MALDEIDRQIIYELQRDGRMTTQALARNVGISEVTARRRLRRLQADGIMQVVAVVDPFLTGIDSPAFVGVKVDRSRLDEVARRLAKHPKVRYVGAATGNAHLIVEVMAASNHELSQFLLEELAAIEGVVDTETSLILKVYKQTWQFDADEAEEADPA
jgi:Lrp/AsnC family transcriptional regulator for asnA, asnC and gidA